MSAELDSLVSIIATQVQEIQAVCASKNATLTSINEADATPGLSIDPTIAHATDIVIAAAKRLIATLRNPFGSVQSVATGMYGSALLHVATEANITEALKEAGPQGLHIRELGPKVGMDPVKLGRVLRYLCAMHNLYQEVSPDVFANNRVSMALDTGKKFEEVKDRGPARYSGSTGAACYAGHTTDELLKGAAVLSDVLLDPQTTATVDPTKAAVMKAVGFDGAWFEWIEQPEEKKRFHRFGQAMKNLDTFFPKELILTRYSWDSIPKGSVVVDVGGGLGGTTLPLAKAFPDLRFVIQDRAPVIADGEKHWNSIFPAAIESGLVKLQAHNFFEIQPVKGAAVYFLRHILHNWDDNDSVKILRALRSSMAPHSKVVILDQIVPYTCPVDDKSLTGEVPEVLHGNLAAGGGMPYMMDIQMLNILNAQERTVGEWEAVANAAGLKIEAMRPGPICSVICVPI